MNRSILLSFCLSYCLAACSSASPAPAAVTCDLSGMVTSTLKAGPTAPCASQPPLMSVTINWASNGGVTINGELCQAWCISGGASGSCSTLGLPIAVNGPDGSGNVCEVDVRCTPGMGISEFAFHAVDDPSKQDIAVTADSGCIYYGQ